MRALLRFYWLQGVDMALTFSWGLLDTIISSGIIGGAIAIWKVFYPVYLRSVKIRLDVHDCWYETIGGSRMNRLRTVRRKSSRVKSVFAYTPMYQWNKRGEKIPKYSDSAGMVYQRLARHI